MQSQASPQPPVERMQLCTLCVYFLHGAALCSFKSHIVKLQLRKGTSGLLSHCFLSLLFHTGLPWPLELIRASVSIQPASGLCKDCWPPRDTALSQTASGKDDSKGDAPVAWVGGQRPFGTGYAQLQTSPSACQSDRGASLPPYPLTSHAGAGLSWKFKFTLSCSLSVQRQAREAAWLLT